MTSCTDGYFIFGRKENMYEKEKSLPTIAPQN